jgi:hypothetical protein
MMVRRDTLTGLIGERGIDFARFTVRRHPGAAG